MVLAFLASMIVSVAANQSEGAAPGSEPLSGTTIERRVDGVQPGATNEPVERDRRVLRERNRIMAQEGQAGSQPEPARDRLDEDQRQERIERLRKLMAQVREMMEEVRELQREFAGPARGPQQPGQAAPPAAARPAAPADAQRLGTQHPRMQPPPPPPAPHAPAMREQHSTGRESGVRDEARQWSERTSFLNMIAKDMANPVTSAMLGLAMTREHMQPEQRARVLSAVLDQVAEPLIVRNTARLILIETLREMGQNDRATELVMQMITENAKAAK